MAWLSRIPPREWKDGPDPHVIGGIRLRELVAPTREAPGGGLRASGVARRAAVLALAALVGLIGPPAAAAGDDHGLGRPCRSEHRSTVRLAPAAAGGMEARFSLAGGALDGAIPLSEPEAREVAAHPDAHVTDVQLGSYEPDRPGDPASPLVCRLDPTYHFSCPATDTLDKLCIEWSSPAIGS